MNNLGNDLTTWAALVGILLPPLCAFLQRDKFSKQWNAILFACAVVAASVIYGFIRYGGDFTWKRWEEVFLAILVWGIGTYHTYWKPSGQIDTLRAVPVGIGVAKKHK